VAREAGTESAGTFKVLIPEGAVGRSDTIPYQPPVDKGSKYTVIQRSDGTYELHSVVVPLPDKVKQGPILCPDPSNDLPASYMSLDRKAASWAIEKQVRA
jgi:hypothetical protein